MATSSNDASTPQATQPPVIRLAMPQDIPVIEQLDRFSTSPTRDISREMEKYFGSVDPSTHERTLIFLAQVGEHVAGKAELMTPPAEDEDVPTPPTIQDSPTVARVGYIKRVVIDPQFRSMGLARALMLHIIAYAQSDLRLTALDLHVWEGNHSASRKYSSRCCTWKPSDS